MGAGKGGAGSARVIFATLMAICLVGVPAALAAGQGNDSRMEKLAGGPDINVSASTLNMSSVPPQFRPTPALFRVFEIEVGGPTMPGPRYMAFGPVAIGMSVDPGLLTVLFAGVVVVAALAAWSVCQRKRDDVKEEKP